MSVSRELLLATPSVALPFSHPPPQIDSDRRAGKHSLAVRFGADQTQLASGLLLMRYFTS